MLLRSLLVTLMLCSVPGPGVVLAGAPCAELPADAVARYQELVASGSEHVAAARYDEALAAFGEAQSICPFDPSLVYNLARTHHLAGDCKTAITLYTQAQTQLAAGLVQTSLDSEKVAQRLAEAEAQCLESAVSITCADGEVALTVNGEDRTCPFHGTLAPGTYEVRAQRGDAEPYVATLVVAQGEPATMAVPALAPAAAAEPLPRHEGASTALWGWIGLGSGAALVATGVVLHFVAESDRDAVREAHVDADGYVDGMTEAEALDLQDGANTLDSVGAVAIGVGAAAVAAGVVLLLLDDSEDAEPVGSVTMGPDHVLFSLWGRF